MYTAIDIKEGSYVVSLNKKGFCVDNGISVSRKTCTPSKRVTAGNAEVTFTKLGKNSIEGLIEDQWDRGIAGIEVKIAGDGMEQSEYTDENGRYQLGVDGDGPFTVTPVPAGRGPSEHYYLIQDKVPTQGISAEVKIQPQDRHRHRRLGTRSHARDARSAASPQAANGHARMDYDLEVITQVGTRVPEGVQLRISNAAGGDPQSCGHLRRQQAGAREQGLRRDERSGPTRTGSSSSPSTPARPRVFYAVLIRLGRRPELRPLLLALLGVRHARDWGGTLPVGEQLNADIRESINQAYAGAQPEPMPTDPIVAVDWLVHLQENARASRASRSGRCTGRTAARPWRCGRWASPEGQPGRLHRGERGRPHPRPEAVRERLPDAADGQRVGARQRERPGARHRPARLRGRPGQRGDVLRLADGDLLATAA